MTHVDVAMQLPSSERVQKKDRVSKCATDKHEPRGFSCTDSPLGNHQKCSVETEFLAGLEGNFTEFMQTHEDFF